MSNVLKQLLHTAATGKAPISAIPIEGHAPVCINRKRLALWIKGVEVVSVKVVTEPDVFYPVEVPVKPSAGWTAEVGYRPHEGPRNMIAEKVAGGHRWLRITGRVGGRVTTTCSLAVIDRRTAVKELSKWSEQERAKAQKKILQGDLATRKARKLKELETIATPELDRAKAAEASILDRARQHGRGALPKPLSADTRLVHTATQVAFRSVPTHTRKASHVILWRLRALRAAWFEITKYNPKRRRTTKNVFLKMRKSLRVIEIVRETVALRARLKAIAPAEVPDPRWADREEYAGIFTINPLHRPKLRRDPYGADYVPSYDRAALAERLRSARTTIAALTPPPDTPEVVVFPAPPQPHAHTPTQRIAA